MSGGGGGGGAADERQTRVIPRLEPILDHQIQEMASLPIPDDLMAEILLRLPTPADLVRASAGCVSFRRVAADRSFLRRYRKIHTPPLVGFFVRGKGLHPTSPPYASASAASAVALAGDRSFLQRFRKLRTLPLVGFHPAIALNPSAAAAIAVALTADFSFSFLPAPASDWLVQDIRDGRVLLKRPMHRVLHNSTFVFPEVVVCDPLHRRYLLLPPIPDNLAALVEDPFLTKKRQLRVQIFLVPTSDSEEAATALETSFRVIWMAQCKTRLVAFVFSSITGQWQAVPSRRWSDLSAGLPPLTARILFYSRNYAYGCFYWVTADGEERKLLVLDIKTMEFSITKPPHEANRCCALAMVEAGEGKPGMLVLADRYDISYFIRQNDGGGSSQWQKVKTVSLDFSTSLICNMEKYLLLCQMQVQHSRLVKVCFTLDIKTFQLEKVCVLDLGSSFDRLHAYSNFPPSLLSSPTISSGVEKGPEEEMLVQGCAASSMQGQHVQNSIHVNAGGQAEE